MCYNTQISIVALCDITNNGAAFLNGIERVHCVSISSGLKTKCSNEADTTTNTFVVVYIIFNVTFVSILKVIDLVKLSLCFTFM